MVAILSIQTILIICWIKFITPSLWLFINLVNSTFLFNFNSSILQDIHILNGIIFLSLLGLIIKVYKNINNKITNNYISILIFFFFLF